MRDPEYHEAGQLTVKGVSHVIKVSDDGNWHAWPGGEHVEAATRNDLERAIARQTRKATAKVAIPFTSLSDNARDGVATGIHSRTRGVLVRWDNGETDQLSSYSRAKFTTRLSDEDKAAWTAMRQQQLEAARWLAQFEKDHEIKLAVAVREALDRAVDE